MINKIYYHTIAICFNLLLAGSLSATDFTIIVQDAPGAGFNSTAPATPVGGNDGTTLGQQRINVLERAMEIWGAELVSDVPVQVNAQMEFLFCDPEIGSAVLASAGATYITHAVSSEVWYPPALANAITNEDSNSMLADIQVNINLSIDESSGCSSVFGGWYYGFDHEEVSQPDLLSTLLHELAHGLGFQSFVDLDTGNLLGGGADIFTSNIMDLESGTPWLEMSSPDRRSSAINDPNVVWSGANLTAQVDSVLARDAALLMRVDTPAELAGKYQAVEAAFGASFEGTINAELVYATPNEGCTTLFTDLTGKIAMIDRGDCEFGVKGVQAQAAGAIAMVVVNNNPEQAIFSMLAGAAGNQVTIPCLMITGADGDTLKAASGVTITLSRDPEPAGSNQGFVRLHAPDPVSGGSSISHFTEDAIPELLMEPFASDTLSDDLDLTIALFMDIGWPTVSGSAATHRLIYPWLSHNTEFESTLVINNLNTSIATATLRARRATGDALEVSVEVPAMGFIERTATDLFPGLVDGGGFSVELESQTAGLEGRWVTVSLTAPSQASPSQGVALTLPDSPGKKQVGNSLLFGYLPNTGETVSAPVIVNVGAEDAAVTLYFYNNSGTLLKQDSTTITALGQYRPFAAAMDTLLPNMKENVMMLAHSPTQPISGAVFVFDATYLEPAIGTAQAVDFTP